VIPDAHRRKTLGYGMAVGGVAVAYEMGGRTIPREGLGDLRAIHSAVGWSVTLSEIRRRRSCRRMTKTNSSRKLIVGTTRKSMAPIPAT
jgi:hypothetical protein